MATSHGLLQHRTVMITGASSGIGAAAARLFAEQGAAVVLMARRVEKLRTIAGDIAAAGGRALVTVGDVTEPDDVERAVSRAVEEFGRLDAAFNNAGWGSIGTPLHETDDAVFRQIMDVNVQGVWNCLKRQIPVMLEQGHGAIVNTCSTAGSFATGAIAPYVAAKHAVLGLTKAAAAEYGERGVRVNALMVGSTRTELMEQAIERVPQLEQAAVARAIQQRLADPLEVARAAAWLCSDQASFVTGAGVPVDGGCSAV
ncbi:glucose 1-dehydrogenase [Streptomyces sp. NPDC004232]|uniref:SDR family NAD(P)-dependent oxidoreductase n=1 Tax=Streptomyces sp. NPDC004232 TaxID=3154454 RepID=UPI001D37AAE8|nr:glucose 1-dehydrogenase [Streptomyces sp. tea 10]